MNEGLTVGGWVFLTCGWLFILSLNVYCFRNLFREKRGQIVGPLEVESEIDKLDK